MHFHSVNYNSVIGTLSGMNGWLFKSNGNTYVRVCNSSNEENSNDDNGRTTTRIKSGPFSFW